MPETKVAVLVGSLRRGSLNRMTANALAGLAPAGMALHQIEIGALPLYDQDLDAAPPQTWTDFRNAIRGSDALLFVTPEYNRSVPAALKNAIDVGSRPYGQSVWDGKPGAIVSVASRPVPGTSRRVSTPGSVGCGCALVTISPGVSTRRPNASTSIVTDGAAAAASATP